MRLRTWAGLTVLLATVACDLPTRLPRWDTTWEAVLLEDTISTADLLPPAVRVGPDGFVIDSFAVTSRVRLADVCELCTCFEGPIPPLEIAAHDRPIQLPPGVAQASLRSGTAEVVLWNEMDFDLLDDGNGGQGHLVVELVDTQAKRTIDRVEIARPFPPGDSIAFRFDLAGLELHQALVARIHGSIPGTTCPVTLGPESGFLARVELRDVVADRVQIFVSDQAFSLRPRRFELPRAVASRLRPGEAELTVEVEMDSRVATSVEIGMSVADRPEALFTRGAALYTPLLLPTGSPAAPARVRRAFLLTLDQLEGAQGLHVGTTTRVTGTRRIELTGAESVGYRIRLRAEIPTQ